MPSGAASPDRLTNPGLAPGGWIGLVAMLGGWPFAPLALIPGEDRQAGGHGLPDDIHPRDEATEANSDGMLFAFALLCV